MSKKYNIDKTLDSKQQEEIEKGAISEISYTLSRRLREYLIESGCNQAELAKLIGCSEGNISQYLKAKRGITGEYLVLIAKALNVTTDYLLGLTEYKTPGKQDIGKSIGLSDKAIDVLHHYKQYEINKVNIKYSKIDKPYTMSYINNLRLLNLLLENEKKYYILTDLAGYIFGDFTSINDRTAKSFEVFNKNIGKPQNINFELIKSLYLIALQKDLQMLYEEQIKKDGDNK